MKSKLLKFFLTLSLAIVFIMGSTFAEGGDGSQKGNTLNKPMGTPIRAYMNINFISTIIKNDGISDINVGQDASGLIYPRGSGKTAVYQSGFLWAAKVNDPGENDPHVGGTTYRSGLQGGWITSTGQVFTESDPRARIYRVRPDVYPGGPSADVSGEAADEAKSESDVRAQYELDWTEWPADLGAPFFDGNNNDQYDSDPSSGDIPGVTGASQTIWYVTNDQSPERTNNMFGTDPMGIEMQATFWGYSQTGALGNMFFRRYLIINKTDILGSNRTFDSMYVSMWSDPDVGDSGDDYAGCDTVLSVSFAYNGKGQDAIYGGTTPAVAFDFFQGPLVDGVAGEDRNKNGVDDAIDFGIFKNQNVGPGKINLPMTAAYYYINTDPLLTDPILGSYAEGAIRFYRFMQGRIGLTNEPFIDPNTGQASTFTLPGDPVTRSGWIDGQQFGYGDRRIGMASGPFVMEPGDTQEVVVAQIVAGAVEGVDRLSAISLMKFYDQVAQVAYDNFFDLPTPSPPPDVTVTELDEEIILDWSKNTERVFATENFDAKGFTFQGYNVYQLPTASSAPSEGIRLATYDVIDGVGKISDLVFDPTTGSVVVLPVQFGNDVGIKRFISIKQDAINQRPLINGIRYYFAVTAYTYTSDPLSVPNNLENPLAILTIIPHSADPGVTYGEGNGSSLEVTHNGTADGGPIVTIVDPAATTGNDYEVFFTQRQEVLTFDGEWVPAGVEKLKKPFDMTGSSISIGAAWTPSPSEVELNFALTLVSPTNAWADGVTITLPAGFTVISADSFAAGGGTVIPVVNGNVITMGLTNGELTQNGIFHGGETWSIIVTTFDPPADIAWRVHDDGFTDPPGPVLDAEGTVTVSLIGEQRLAKYWNVRDLSGGVVLENQSIIAGTDIYPRRNDILTDVGLDASPIADGFQINVDVGYAAPTTLSQNNPPLLNGEDVFTYSGTQVWWVSDNYTVGDFTRFGNITGTSNEATGYGSLLVDDLQQDYEFRWTGVTGDTVINNQTIVITKSGGSIATFYGARLYDPGLHPLNPNPGSPDRFLVRIPFEVWNLDQNIQVNYEIYDRGQADPAANGFMVWNTLARMYSQILNTPYNPNAIADPNVDGDEYTWNNAWFVSTFTTGDVLRINYDNPIQIGIDTYEFSTTASAYSSDLALNQVDQINVFPNPYYGFNTEELNKYNRFVTFNHMPEQAKIRIFNLAGVLVKTIDKEDPGQFLRWDLANEDGLPVASGLYIAYVELPELGTTKILKLAIIQEQQVLDRF